MEKSEAIRRFNEGKHYIETCLEQIASLEQNNDKELHQVLRGTVMVEVSYKAAENFCKVGSYVIDGKDGAQKLKDKLINLKVKVLQLYDGADRNNLLMIKNICDTIISVINEVEEWTGDNEQTNQETTQSEIVPETKTDKENPKTKAQIMMSIENEPFKPKKDGKPVPYQKCFERLTMGKIRHSVGESESVEVIDKQYDFELFKYCVDRANIKYLIKEKKCFAYLFLRCISEYFENPFEYRKAAAKSFGIKTISNVGGVTKSDFYNLFSGIFKNEDIPRKNRK